MLQGTAETRVQERKGANRIYWYQVGREQVGEGQATLLVDRSMLFAVCEMQPCPIKVSCGHVPLLLAAA